MNQQQTVLDAMNRIATSTTEEQQLPSNPLFGSKPLSTHPNVTKMYNAFEAVIEEPEFYNSEPKVNKFLESCKLPDPAQKYWKSSMTNARKELNDKAMQDAKQANMPVEMPSDEAIEELAIQKFKETWKKYGKGKPMPTLPLVI